MPIQITCPSCSRLLQVPDSLMGKRVKCPTCSATFTAADAPSEPPPTPPREEAPSPKEESSPPGEPPAQFSERRPEERSGEVRGLDLGEEDRPRRRRSRYDDDDLGPRRGMDHRGAMILTFGILSIVLPVVLICCCSGIVSAGFGLGFGLPAWIMGNADLAKMRKGLMDPRGENLTRSGWICGIIGTIIGGLCLVCGVGYFILVLSGNMAGGFGGPGAFGPPAGGGGR